MQQRALILPSHDGSGTALIPPARILPPMAVLAASLGIVVSWKHSQHQSPSLQRKEKLVIPFPLGDHSEPGACGACAAWGC